MAKKFQDLMDQTMSPERQAAAQARAGVLVADMALAELRRARELTQKDLAERMQRGQSAVSQMESRTDAYVSTLRHYIESMGGELEIVARFPEGDVRIIQFADVAKAG